MSNGCQVIIYNTCKDASFDIDGQILGPKSPDVPAPCVTIETNTGSLPVTVNGDPIGLYYDVDHQVHDVPPGAASFTIILPPSFCTPGNEESVPNVTIGDAQ